MSPAPEPAPVERLYLPELDGLRTAAFALVFLFHQGVPWPVVAGWAGHHGARAFRENGWVGVQLFFVLSGYLITTLLLREQAARGRIDLRAFFVRRTLRIWPLYYLTVALSFLAIPILQGTLRQAEAGGNLARHLPSFLLFLGNWSMVTRGPVATDAQSVLWSVCVEEQFYLAVPWLIAWTRGRVRVGLVVALMGLSVATRAYLARLGVPQMALQYNTVAQFDTLLSGVLLALMLGPDPRGRRRTARVLTWLQGPLYLAALWVFSRPTLGHGAAGHRTWDFVLIWAVCVGLVAVAVTVPGRLRAGLAWPPLVRLGRISYGLYMFHEVAFLLRDRFAGLVGWFPFQDTLLPFVSLGFTVGLAWVSYDFLERPFLKLKARWERVPSRPL